MNKRLKKLCKKREQIVEIREEEFLRQSNRRSREAKIIMLGNPNVGKTSIIKAFTENMPQRRGSANRTNVCQDVYRAMRVTKDDGSTKDIVLKIWDAAGDTDMHNVVSLFVRDVVCCILVYSIES